MDFPLEGRQLYADRVDVDPEWRNEDEYVATLEAERRRFAWVLQRYGGKARAEADADAMAFYYYEEPDTPCRGLVFHDEAWHWAMVGLHGSYWQTHPELVSPSAEYDEIE
ncbi:hypothetical protein [Nocardia sp. NPDC060259]|uniref:hypothetical protein n=1 Tax=Nocardia sp. NPDC060259 TaxID=3347088 RepID=UPI00364A17F2